MLRRLKSLFLAIAVLLALPMAAFAQANYWVQIEAHATLRTAEDYASRYNARFGSVAGFRIGGGWYALAIGPYETEADASAVLQRMITERSIRPDAYVTDGSIYAEQFWPAGGALTAPAAPAEVAPAAPEAPAQPSAPVVVAVEPTPAPEPAPVVETLREARARDAALSRDQRAEIQTALQWLGFYNQRVDAAFGPGSRNAIGAWQSAQGFEATGFLTGGQMDLLLGTYAAAIARYDFRPVRDESAGIEITLPMGMVQFGRHESPFAHFDSVNNSGIQVLLLSQEGNQATLFGLYEIMQTLSVIPLEGERNRRDTSFLLTGQNDVRRAHVEARLENGRIKGWALLWQPSADPDAELILSTLQSSFRPIDGVLPGNLGAGASTVSHAALIAGLEVRRPLLSRSGFYADASGTVVTALDTVQACGRITLDGAYPARLTHADSATGVAVLTPTEPLVPLAFATFTTLPPQIDAEARLAGFTYQDALTRPLLTFGRVAAAEGINGEPELRRLALVAQEGDIGGPIFDGNGGVLGLLLPDPQLANRMLPEDMSIAASAGAILSALETAGRRGTLNRDTQAMAPETLTRVAGDLTVLVSCWE